MEPNEKAAPQDVTESQLSAIVSKAVESAFGTRLTDLEKSVKTLGEKAGPGLGERITVRAPEDQIPEDQRKGIRAAQWVRCVAATTLYARQGNPMNAGQVAEKLFGGDHPVTKAIVRALGSDSLAAGGALVPTEFSTDLIELLRPASVVRRLNPTILPMDNGKLSIPKLTGGASASYVGENANIGKTEQTFGDLNLSAKKLGALVPISNDLIRRSSPQADMVVRDDVVAALAQRGDLAFIRGDGTGYTPRGLRSWTPTANAIPANATVNLANVTTDLNKLVNALEQADVRMLRPGWLMAPRSKNYLMTVRDGNGNFAFRDEMLAGNLWGFPFGVTSQIPITLSTNKSEVYLVDFADFVIGESTNLLLDSSMEAAYYDGSAVQAAFSRDQTVIRAIQEHDSGMRHDASVAYLYDVTWGV